MPNESNPYLLVPIVFFFLIAFYMQAVVSAQLISQKVCYPNAPPGVETICTNDEALKKGNDMMMTRSMIRETIPAVVVLWAGSWRDRTGMSKVLVLVALSGELISEAFILISTQIWSINPWFIVFVDSIIPGITGTRHLIFTAILPLVTENVSDEQKFSRSTLIFVGLLGGACVGQAVSGFILKYANYIGYCIVVLAVQTLTLILTAFFLKNSEKKKTEGGFLTTIKRLKVVFERRPNKLAIWCLIIPNFTIASLLLCEGTVTSAFYNKTLKLPQDAISLLTFYRLFIALIATGVLTPLFLKVLKVPEFYLAIFGSMMCAASSFCMHFAQNLLQAYLFSTLDLMRIVLLSVLWTLVTKFIKNSEVGMFASFLVIGEALMPLILTPLYNYISNSTMETDPGTFYLLSGGIITCSTCLIIIATCSYVKVNVESTDETDETEVKE